VVASLNANKNLAMRLEQRRSLREKNTGWKLCPLDADTRRSCGFNDLPLWVRNRSNRLGFDRKSERIAGEADIPYGF
jgi:hypothetical protein